MADTLKLTDTLINEAEFLYEYLKDNSIIKTSYKIGTVDDTGNIANAIYKVDFSTLDNFKKYYINILYREYHNDNESDGFDRFLTFVRDNTTTGIYDFDVVLASALYNEFYN